MERRLLESHGHLSNAFDVKYVWQAIRDWKVYIFMLICMAGFCPIYSFALFLPTIIKNMGYTANNAQLMSVPPYVFACFFTIAASWFADRIRQRGVFLLGFQVVAVAGFALLAGSGNASVQYTGTVLAAIGGSWSFLCLSKVPWVEMLTLCARNIPPDSPGHGMERRQHWRESEAWDGNRYAGDGRELWWHHRVLCLPLARRPAVRHRSLHPDRYCLVSPSPGRPAGPIHTDGVTAWRFS